MRAQARWQRPGRLAALAFGLLCWKVQDCGFVDGEPDGALKSLFLRMAQPWKQPHRVHLSHGGFHLDGQVQGLSQYHLTLSEGAGPQQPAVVLSKLGNGSSSISFQYDSTRSKYKPTIRGVNRIAAIGGSTPGFGGFDWTLDLEGENGRHFSISGNEESVVYDGSLSAEVSIPQSKGLSALYAVDFKRPEGADGIHPSLVRQGAALQYKSKAGTAKVIVHQSDPAYGDVGVNFEASFRGELPDLGISNFALSAKKEHLDPPQLVGKAHFNGREGVSGDLSLGFDGSTPKLAANLGLERRQTVIKGLTISGKTSVVATPLEEEVMTVLPVNLGASVRLGELLPDLLSPSSSIEVGTSYRPGAERAAVNVRTSVVLKKGLPMMLLAQGLMDDEGKTAGRASIMAATNQGLVGRYEVRLDGTKLASQVGEVSVPLARERLPFNFLDAMVGVYGRVTQSDQDHNGKPRLHLGLAYEFDTSLAGRHVDVKGSSGLYDEGEALIAEDGKPLLHEQLERAQKTADAVRKHTELASGLGHDWLRK